MSILRLLVILACLFPPVLAHASCAGRSITTYVEPGPICIQDRASRVVVIDPFYNLGMALELGVPVVGAPLTATPDADLRRRASTFATDIGDARQPSLERIVALKPDLIIGDAQLQGQLYERLARIAPTALIRAGSWKENLTALADITGKSDVAAKALGDFEARAAAIRKRMVGDTKVSVIRIATHGFHVYLDGPAAYAPYAVLHEAGVRRTPYETTDGDAVFRRPDWEEIASLNGDILLYVVAAGNAAGQDEALEASTLANPFWQMLPSVRSGHAYRVDKAHWFGFNSIASAHRVLDDVERYILDGR